MSDRQPELANHPLTIMLQAAVPLRMMELQEIPDPALRWATIQRWAAEGEATLHGTGEAILFRTAKQGDSARAANAVAKAIAALAYMPGGITIFGQHWQAEVSR